MPLKVVKSLTLQMVCMRLQRPGRESLALFHSDSEKGQSLQMLKHLQSNFHKQFMNSNTNCLDCYKLYC